MNLIDLILKTASSNECVEKSIEKSERQPVWTQYIVKPNAFQAAPAIQLTSSLPADVYKAETDYEGNCFFEKHPLLSDELLRFDDERYASVIDEIDNFWKLKENYSKLGFAHKRGILLYGAPGTGKSCLLKLIAENCVNADNIVLVAKSPRNLVSCIKSLRDIEPNKKVLVLLEDIDEIISYDEHSILELFDGDSQVDNVLYLATTNYIDRLPPRMLRANRFDRKIEIGNPPFSGRLAYFLSKLGSGSEQECDRLARLTEDLSFAQLREFMVSVYCLKYPEQLALKRICDNVESLVR